MDFEPVLQKVISLAREQFRDEKDEINESTTAAAVATWNSLTHVMLITAIEKSFGIRFELLEMIGMKSLGDIARATHDKVK
ncbi:MAG: acyl carrier protein [Bacteroidota bacterium]